MNNRADHWSGMVNFISTGGSRLLASASFAFNRSAAALAASRSPAVVAPKNSASTFLNRSRSSSSIAMALLLEQHDRLDGLALVLPRAHGRSWRGARFPSLGGDRNNVAH